MMRRLLLAAALATASLPLTACVGTAHLSADTVASVQARYDRLRPYAELILPSLSPARAARVRLALATIERALELAKVATTVAEQRRALTIANTALAAVPATTR